MSAREQSGVEIIKDVAGLKSQLVLEPTLILDRTDWEDLADCSIKKISEPYIFCYFLGTNAEYRRHVKKLQEQTDIKL